MARATPEADAGGEEKEGQKVEEQNYSATPTSSTRRIRAGSSQGFD